MKILIAMDSFKGSLDSIECGNAVKSGILKSLPDSDITIFPLADGGEGMAKTLSDAVNAKWLTVTVSNPLGRKISAGYGYIKNTNTAIIEMASAAGLALLSPEQYNPMIATTYGVGELILEAYSHGARHFIIGIGGSATNDAGIGMLKALGYQFLDRDGKDAGHGANALSKIFSINYDDVFPGLKECTFEIACDVDNPLYGQNGATYTYGPQKGIPLDKLETIDCWMRHFSDIASKSTHRFVSEYPGTGAAGGMGFAFLAFLNAKLISGAELTLNILNIEDFIRQTDLVITGEGRLDSQTVHGKGPITIAKLAKKHNKKVIAFSGCLGENAMLCNLHGIDAYFPILTDICSLEEALSNKKANENLTVTVEQVFRLIGLYQR